MKNLPPVLPISAALAAALILSSCGKQEAVGDVPSSEELAKQADAASQAIRDEAAEAAGKAEDAPAVDSAAMTSYTNALRGYSIMVPRKWEQEEAASDDNGGVYKNADTGATLTVGWVENREDADLKAAVQSIEDAGDAMTGAYVRENDYRASGSLSDGQKTARRILRKPDGTMVNATISYPADQAQATEAAAKQILDSLTLQP